MAAIEVQHFLGRAREFRNGMRNLIRMEGYIVQDEVKKFCYSVGLLGIHCAISYGDALRIGMGSKKIADEDHSKAADDLEGLLKTRNYENRRGISHFKSLLGMKSKVAYARVTVSENQIDDVVKHVERFADWAEEVGLKLQIGGWSLE